MGLGNMLEIGTDPGRVSRHNGQPCFPNPELGVEAHSAPFSPGGRRVGDEREHGHSGRVMGSLLCQRLLLANPDDAMADLAQQRLLMAEDQHAKPPVLALAYQAA